MPSERQNQFRHNRLVLMIASCVTVLIALDSSLLNVALPAIKTSFPKAATTSVTWVINIYSLSIAGMLVPAGFLADRFGRKRLLLAGIFGFMLGCILCSTSTSITSLLIARLLQGAGGALALPASLAIVLTAFSGPDRAIAVGKWSAAGAIAAGLGPFLGGVLLHYISWRALFLLHVPVCLWASLRACISLVNATADALASAAQIFLAAPAFGLGMGLLLISVCTNLLTATPTARFVAILTSVTLVATAVATWGKHKAFSSSAIPISVTTFFFGAVFGGMFVFYDFVLVYSCHLSIARAAVLVGLIPLISIPAARYAGKMHQRYSSTVTLLIGSGALLTAVLLSFIVAGRGFASTAWIATVVLSGVGIGLCFPTLSIEAVKGSPSSSFALLSGLNQSFRHAGTAAGVALIGTTVDRIAYRYIAAWSVVFIFAVITVVSATIVVVKGGQAAHNDRQRSTQLAN